MMAGEEGAGQVIEARLAGRASVALALWLPVVMAVPRHLVTLALRTPHALGPAQTPDRVEAFGIIDQGWELDQAVHRGRSLAAADGGIRDERYHPLISPVTSTGRRSDQLPSCRPPPQNLT